MAYIYQDNRTAPLNDRVLTPQNALLCATRMYQHFYHDIVLDISFIRERHYMLPLPQSTTTRYSTIRADAVLLR